MTRSDRGCRIDPGEDAAFTIARHAVDLRYEDLPSAVVDLTKKGILDTLGVVLPASSTSPEAIALVGIMREVGGKPEATILGFGDKVPAWHAGYVNGAMANCLDYSDLHPAAAHINSPVLPATMAMAERLGGVSGKELITAVALGVDLQCRLTMCPTRRLGERKGWHPAPLFGVFGSTLACGKLLGLTADQMVNALGLAFVQAAGTLEIVLGPDSTVRGIGHAVPGEVGVRASLMAAKGITGVRNSFEGQSGLLNVHFDGRYDRSVLVGDLGRTYPVLDDGFKPWPTCGFTHIYIDMVLELLNEHRLRAQDIGSVVVVVGDFALGQTEPVAQWRQPSNTMLAKLSIPFSVAVALQKGAVRIGDFLPEHLSDPEVLDMAQRVTSRFDNAYNFTGGTGMPPGEIEITTTDGRVFAMKRDRAYGHPLRPMSWNDLVAKFKDCAAYSATPLSEATVDTAIDLLGNLEHADDASVIPGLLG